MTIRVNVRNVYGNETIYPACEKAKVFCLMLNQKTLTRANIRHIKELGYFVELSMSGLESLQ